MHNTRLNINCFLYIIGFLSFTVARSSRARQSADKSGNTQCNRSEDFSSHYDGTRLSMRWHRVLWASLGVFFRLRHRSTLYNNVCAGFRCLCTSPPQTLDGVTGSTEVSGGVGPLLGHLVFRRHKSHEVHRFLSSSKAFVLQPRHRGYQQGSGNSVYNRPTYAAW